MTLSIRTNQLSTRKQVEIDGHHYTVRKMGNIEQLDMSQYFRRLKKLSELEAKNDNKLTAAQTRELDDLSSKMANMFVALFDDGGDQSKSRALVASLSDVEIGLLLAQIFKEDETPDETGSDETS